jgi:hypothetical protein
MTEKPGKAPEQAVDGAEQAQRPPEPPPVALQRVDLPELAETFADSLELVFFDGQTLRINFGVTRFDQPIASEGNRVDSSTMRAATCILGGASKSGSVIGHASPHAARWTAARQMDSYLIPISLVTAAFGIAVVLLWVYWPK